VSGFTRGRFRDPMGGTGSAPDSGGTLVGGEGGDSEGVCMSLAREHNRRRSERRKAKNGVEAASGVRGARGSGQALGWRKSKSVDRAATSRPP